jgi:hypothetical protein
MKWSFILAGLMALTTGVAQAGLLPVSVTTTNEGSNTRFDYSVLLQSDAMLKTGDYFTIYDFAGFIPDSNTQPSNFSFSTSASGQTPSRVVPNDDPAIPNLTWTYTGSDTQIGELALGSFTAASHYSRSRDDDFTGQTHRQVDGHLNSNITDTRVPVPDPCHPPAVPEPSSVLLLGLALPLALGAHALKKAKRGMQAA